MGFWIYRKAAHKTGVRYQRQQSLQLGGPGGAIAQHVRRLSDAEARNWSLEVPGLLPGAAPDPAGGEWAVVFDGSGRGESGACLYEVLRVHGSCRDTSTQLAVDFAILVDGEVPGGAALFAQEFEMADTTSLPRLSEALALTGGPAGGDWRWTRPPLQLGAAVIQPRAPATA